MEGLLPRKIVLALLLLLAACSVGGEGPGLGARRPSDRGPTEPGVDVLNEASGVERARIYLAVDDLRRLGFWDRLTKGLAAVEIGARTGRADVPADGHLADAFASVRPGPDGGAVCDVMMYATAIDDDLARWSRFHRQRRISRPPPSLREYWALLLGHELVHCLPTNSGERAATRWEWRIRKAFGKR